MASVSRGGTERLRRSVAKRGRRRCRAAARSLTAAATCTRKPVLLLALHTRSRWTYARRRLLAEPNYELVDECAHRGRQPAARGEHEVDDALGRVPLG